MADFVYQSSRPLVLPSTKLIDTIGAGCAIDLEAENKNDALLELSRALAKTDRVTDGDAFHRALMERELQASTGVGLGVAIPHVKIAQVTDYVAAVGRSRKGIEFGAIDGKPVHLIFMIGASDRQTREFVRILAAVTHLIKSSPVRDALMAAAMPDEFLAVIRENER